MPGQTVVIGHQTLAVSSSAVGLTVPAPAARSVTYAVIQVTGADIRWRADGTTPTGASGFMAYNKKEFILSGVVNLGQFKAIRAAGIDAELNIIYYRE